MTENKKLSKREQNMKRTLDFLEDFIRSEGYSPSVRDICKALDIKSTSTVHGYLTDLQEAGLISYADGKRRAISIVGMLDDEVDNQDDFYEDHVNPDDIIGLPLIGLVTAGRPILAQENVQYTIALDEKLFPPDKDGNFLLKVRGDSMIEVGILDGDLLVVEVAQTADNNDIIIALIGEEATVKRFSYLDGRPYLFPENPYYAPIPFDTEECRILGKVKGLIRTRV